MILKFDMFKRIKKANERKYEKRWKIYLRTVSGPFFMSRSFTSRFFLPFFGVKKCWSTSFSSSNFNDSLYWRRFKWVIKAVKIIHDQLPVPIAKKNTLSHQLTGLSLDSEKNDWKDSSILWKKTNWMERHNTKRPLTHM